MSANAIRQNISAREKRRKLFQILNFVAFGLYLASLSGSALAYGLAGGLMPPVHLARACLSYLLVSLALTSLGIRAISFFLSKRMYILVKRSVLRGNGVVYSFCAAVLVCCGRACFSIGPFILLSLLIAIAAALQFSSPRLSPVTVLRSSIFSRTLSSKSQIHMLPEKLSLVSSLFSAPCFVLLLCMQESLVRGLGALPASLFAFTLLWTLLLHMCFVAAVTNCAMYFVLDRAPGVCASPFYLATKKALLMFPHIALAALFLPVLASLQVFEAVLQCVSRRKRRMRWDSEAGIMPSDSGCEKEAGTGLLHDLRTTGLQRSLLQSVLYRTDLLTASCRSASQKPLCPGTVALHRLFGLKPLFGYASIIVNLPYLFLAPFIVPSSATYASPFTGPSENVSSYMNFQNLEPDLLLTGVFVFSIINFMFVHRALLLMLTVIVDFIGASAPAGEGVCSEFYAVIKGEITAIPGLGSWALERPNRKCFERLSVLATL